MFAVAAPVPWEIEGPEGTAKQPGGEGTPVGRIALLRPGGLLYCTLSRLVNLIFIDIQENHQDSFPFQNKFSSHLSVFYNKYAMDKRAGSWHGFS